MDARRFKESKGVTNSFRIKWFDHITNVKFETESAMLHLDLEYLPDSVFGPRVIPRKAKCSQTATV